MKLQSMFISLRKPQSQHISQLKLTSLWLLLNTKYPIPTTQNPNLNHLPEPQLRTSLDYLITYLFA